MKTVVGLFGTRTRAREVLSDLEAAGFDVQNVTVLTAPHKANPQNTASDDDNNRNRADELSSERLPNTYSTLTGRLMTPGLTGTPSASEVPAASQSVDVEGIQSSAEIAKTLKSWGFTDNQVKGYEQQLDKGVVLVAVEIVDNNRHYSE